jgi:hypothetical protein
MSLDKPELPLPRDQTGAGRDNLGIRYEGSVIPALLGLNPPPPATPTDRVFSYHGRPIEPDPVLRHHLNLPPLPDPYEERRRRAEAFRQLKESGKIIVW